MFEYSVELLDNEFELETVLNNKARDGWRLHSIETEYKTYVVIFEKELD